MKREQGEALVANALAAPATVNGERRPDATDRKVGKAGGASSREPGDLPSKPGAYAHPLNPDHRAVGAVQESLCTSNQKSLLAPKFSSVMQQPQVPLASAPNLPSTAYAAMVALPPWLCVAC